MIIVFVVDTSPSMATKLVDIGMSKLDLAKMAVESLAKGLSKRVHEHNIAYAQAQQSLYNLGLGYAPQDQFLLLSTSRQFDNTAECGAGGRLLVGFTDYHTQDKAPLDVHSHSHQEFDRALKKLQASSFSAGEGAVGTSTIPFPEDAGGALGLNAALSAGLALLGRYRLQNRCTENFGMGRLPNNAMLLPSGQGAANAALQPACLVLLTDGECLKQKTPGGGLLELQFGNQPLREFYQEPFRWDQRIFCLAISTSTESSTQFLHPSLRALCDVTGGCHAMLRSTASLSQLTDQLVKLLAPPRPTLLPLEDPTAQLPVSASLRLPHGTYVQGGPICCFQGLEAGPNGEASPISRAMLLFTPHQTASAASAIPSPPIWWLPEAYFPNKALDSLPPRLAQPLLTYSRHYSVVGSNTFDPSVVAKQLGILDQLVLHNKQGGKVVQRDVYICEFLSPDGRPGQPPRGSSSSEYLPIAVRGAGRAMSEGEESMLNIGILHVPANVKSVIAGGSNSTLAKYATLTLLPPEPHILLPLLIKAAEAESRMLKKYPDKPRAVHLDDVWRSELRAYLFRIPPYYHVALKRCLRPILPASVQNLLSTDGVESLASQCFSKSCLQKIRAGELLQKENNERLERQERDLRRRGASEKGVTVGYGQYDPRGTKSNYLAALRSLPAPWKVGFGSKGSKVRDESAMSDVTSTVSESELRKTAADILGDLPTDCLVAYYESRRRWIFGGSGLTTRNVFVEGVCNHGTNSQRCSAKPKPEEEALLAVSGVGVSTLNNMATVKMGDYRERLLWARAPIVGYGSNDCGGIAATTAADGSPKWSVDDDALPLSFFDPKTGEFADSVQARVRSRLMVHFGNPFKDKRGDSVIPEAFLIQRPPRKGTGTDAGDMDPMTPPGSPPHETYSSVEGEGEAVFASSPPRKSPQHSSFPPSPDRVSTVVMSSAKKRETPETPTMQPEGKRAKKEVSLQVKSEKMSPEKKPMPADVVPKPPPSVSRPLPPSTSSRPPAPPAPPVPPGAVKPKRGNAPPPPKPPSLGPPPKPKPPHRGSLGLGAPPPRAPPPAKTPMPPRDKDVVAPPKAPPTNPPGELVMQSVAPSPSAAISSSSAPSPSGPPSGPVASPKPPVPTKKLAQIPPAMSLSSGSAETASAESPDAKPDVTLPPGWMCVWSKSQKRWYYFDTKTNKSVWQWPPPS